MLCCATKLAKSSGRHRLPELLSSTMSSHGWQQHHLRAEVFEIEFRPHFSFRAASLSAWVPGANGGGVALPPPPTLPCALPAPELPASTLMPPSSVAPTAAAATAAAGRLAGRGNSTLQLAKSLSCSSLKATGPALAISSWVGMIKCPSESKESCLRVSASRP